MFSFLFSFLTLHTVRNESDIQKSLMSERCVSEDVYDIIKKLTEHHTRIDGLTDENITADFIIMTLIVNSSNLAVQQIFSYFLTNGKPLLSTTQMSVSPLQSAQALTIMHVGYVIGKHMHIFSVSI